MLGARRQARWVRDSMELRAGLASALSAAATFLAGLVVARALPPDERGTLAVIQVTMILLAAPAALGMGPAVVYFLPQRPHERHSIIATGLTVAGSASVVVTALGIAGLTFLSRPGVASIQLLGVVPFAVSGVMVEIWRARGDTRSWNRGRVAGPISWLAAATVVTATGSASVQSLVIAQVTVYTFVWICVTALQREALSSVLERRVVSRTMAAEMTIYGAPTAGAHLLGHASRRLDLLLIAAVVPSALVGQYAVAATWSSSLLVIGLTLGQPSTARIAALPREESMRAARRVVISVVPPIMAMTALAIASAPAAIPFLFGDDYRKAVGPAMVLCVGTGLAAIGSILTEMSRATGHPGIPLLAEAISVGSALVAVPILTARWSINGTAVASVLGYGLAAACLLGVLQWRSGHRHTFGQGID